MTKSKFNFVLIASLTMGLTLMSCSNTSNKSTKTEQTVNQTEFASDYVCPMHCIGSGSDNAGKCPVCGIDYVKNEDHKKDGHTHEKHNH